MLKQRTKLNNNECPICKEKSDRVLITDNVIDKISNWNGSWIEDPNTGVVFANASIKNEIDRKTGLHCKACEKKGVKAKYPSIKALREHLVKYHKMDFC